MSRELRQIIDELVEKKLSRRQFITRASALGLSMGSIGAILTACGGAATPAATETGTAAATTTSGASTATAAASATTAAATATSAATAAAVTGTTPPDKIIGAMGLDIDDLDPHYFKSNPGYLVTGNLYELMEDYVLEENDVGALVPVADDNGVWKFTPANCEWSRSSDGTVLTFKLREGAKFADGNPITVDDWMYSWTRALLNLDAYTYSNMNMITIMDQSQLKAVDANTFQFVMQKDVPFAEMAIDDNTGAILEKAVVEQHSSDQDKWGHEWLKTNPTANGAYTLKNWTPGVGWELEPNANYWDAANVKNKGVIFKVVPNPQDRVSLLTKGDVDLALDIALKDLAQLKNDPNIKLFDFPIPDCFYLGMNTKMPPFDKKEVRQAIAYATPYKTIIDQVMFGFAKELKSPIGQGMPGHDPSFWHYDTDLQKAKQLLDAAGQSNLSFKIACLLGRPEDEQTAVWIQSNLAQIGVQVEVDKMNDAQYYDEFNNRTLPAFISEWYSWLNDPINHVYWLFKSDVGTNATQYNNPQVDKLITDGMYETDAQKRMDMVKQIQQLIVEDSPWVFLYQKDWVVAARKNVMHYPWYPDTVARFKHTYKA